MTHVARDYQPEAIAANSSVTPLRARIFGFAAVAPIGVGVAAVLAAPSAWQGALCHAVVLWSASILCFLAGVRRGDSFHTPGGPVALQMPAIFGVWGAGLAALVAAPVWAVAVLLAGYVAVGWLDWVAARHRLAPLFFARFRPVQMMIPVLSLAVLLAWCARTPDVAANGWGCNGGAVCLGHSIAAPSLLGAGFTQEGHHGERYYF